MKIAISTVDADGWQRELLDQKDMGNYVVKTERVAPPSDSANPVEMKTAYTHDGAYIGDPKMAKRLVIERGILPELAGDHSNVCSIGFCEKDGKWYGWSHRAIYGFKPGSTCKKGDCQYTPDKGEWTAKTIDDAKQMAKDFASSVSASVSSPVRLRSWWNDSI